MARLASMGMELEDVADDGKVALPALAELAEDRGRPASHYIAALALATELSLESDSDAVTLRVCAGNCQRYGWDPIVLVLNNKSWEMLRAFDPAASFTNLDDWHFADIAPSLGGIGRRVSTTAELKLALESAFGSRGKFQLIEIMLEKGAISRTLAQFVETMKQRQCVK